MSDFRTVTLVLPTHTAEKLDALVDHYLIPLDMIIQKVIVDRTDEIHDLVILQPMRNEVPK